jgi:rare lipoprotein A
VKALACLALMLLLAGCGGIAKRETTPEPPKRGAYYKDDGPGENPPPNLASIPDAEPKAEPLHRFANRPYQVFGRDYVPLTDARDFRQRGIASWYGRRFHGGPTSSGEPYDMYAMTAAHPVLPVPSYVRVTNVANGRSVVVRVNDRGPFHAERAIDLSYTAAYKLGFADSGSALVEIEALAPLRAGVETPPSSGIFLQLGAFAVRENAEALRERLARELAWLAQSMQVVAGQALYRLQLGPYNTEEEARAIAERIRAQLSVAPLVVVR